MTPLVRPPILLPYLLSGALLAACSPSIAWWPLVFVAAVPLFWAVERDFERGRAGFGRAFVLGSVPGLCYGGALFYWVAHVSATGLVLIELFFGAVFGTVAAGVLLGLRAGLPGGWLCLWSACVWVGVEVFASDVFWTLPSAALGYMLWPVPLLVQGADVTGVFGVSFWVIGVNALACRWLRSGPRAVPGWAASVAALTAAVLVYGRLGLSACVGDGTAAMRVALVHTATARDRRPDREIFDDLAQRTRAAVPPGAAELVVWPETSVPAPLRRVEERTIVEGLLGLSRDLGAPVLLGALSHERREGRRPELFNAAFLVPAKGFVSQEYHKMLLAPFHEMDPLAGFVPEGWAAARRRPAFVPGSELGVMELDSGEAAGVLICYEALFPGLARRLAARAGVLVNITDDRTAYGDLAPAYRSPLTHAVYRAVETRRYVLRCANWGRSLVISPAGEILASSGVGEAGVLKASVRPSRAQTFVVRHGFVLAKALFFGTAAAAVLLFLRARSRGSSV